MTKEILEEALDIMRSHIPNGVQDTIDKIKDWGPFGDLHIDVPKYYAIDYLTAYLKKYGEIELPEEKSNEHL